MDETHPNERTGLLQASHEDEELQYGSNAQDPDKTRATPTPLPWRALFVLYLLNSVQPLAFELIFPFINQMILDNGVVDDPERVGFYSGLIESIFSCMSFLAILPSSFFSDRIGRKPVILFGISGLAISISLFGMSKSLWFMIPTRCLGGALGGTWASTKIMVAELTDKSNQAAAFSGLSIAYRVGQTVGQPIGGFLVHPDRHWSWFKTPFWSSYPYSLPCFVAGGFAAGAVFLGYFNLEETLASKRPKKYQNTDSCQVGEAPNDVTDSLSETTLEEDRRPPFLSVLTSYMLSLLVSTMGMVFASDIIFALYPLFAFTPIKSGGLGLNEASIGMHMAVRSVINVLFMMFYSPLERRMGTIRLYQFSMSLWPVCVAFYPLLNVMARNGLDNTWLFYTVLLIFYAVWSIASLGWPGVGILVNNAAPSASALAVINGVSQMAIALPQAGAPAFVTSLFAYSIKSHLLGGNLIWVVMLAFTTVFAVHSLTLKESTHDWREDYQHKVST